MRREYIERYVKEYMPKKTFESLPALFEAAALDPEGEDAGLVKVAQKIGVPPVRPGCCISCGFVEADFGFEKEPALWCTMHRPAGTVNRVPLWKKRERYEACIDNARCMEYDD
jgi:hypothetical protein